jgi:myo-inositol-1(or 4)-monophosphatase
LPVSELDDGLLVRETTAAVRVAGELALRLFRSPVKSWTKGKSSPVSEADIAVDELLKERLSATGPDHGWLSEETEDDPARLSARRVWVVDPIDGTRAFLSGRIDWTISVALVEAGRPVLAVLYAPASEEMFVAVAGGGATCNGVPIVATAGERLDGARVAGPKPVVDWMFEPVSGIVPEPKVHSLALRFARVAQGHLDAALAGANSHDWDLAAADLLVHEAKGVLTTLGGETIIYNRPTPTHGALVAAGCSRHRALRGLVGSRSFGSR